VAYLFLVKREQPRVQTTENTKKVVAQFFDRMGAGTDPIAIASLFSEDVDWLVPGDERIAWIGRKLGRSGVADFVRDLRRLTTPIRVTVRTVVSEDENAVAVLDLETRVNSTGKVIRTESAFVFTVRDDLIVRFRLFEDSYAVARALSIQ
jgi:ketosteroid isomerase-like protein